MQMGKGLHNDDWAVDFHQLYDEAVGKFREGIRAPEELFQRDGIEFLCAIGCSPQEVFDFAEDWCVGHEPSFETVLLITSVRRDYFLYVQKGRPSVHVVSMDALPSKEAELGGFPWLPRIIEKARAKLRGEMPPQLMYCCGGDRSFLKHVNIHPADFLREAWAAGDSEERVLQFVKRCVAWNKHQPVSA